ncbi:MAG: phosphotransferase [Acidimicrobiales bacterium]
MTLGAEEHLVALLAELWPAARVELHPPLRGSQNRHGRVFPDNGSQALFVKLYADAMCYETEERVLAALASNLSWPILPTGSGMHGGVAWRSFPLTQLSEVELNPRTLFIWGQRLAEVHGCDTPGELERSPRAADVVVPRLERLDAYDLPEVVDAAQQAKRLWGRAEGTVGKDSLAHVDREVLLTHDFGSRNTKILPDGTMTLIDFERAGAGDPHWDLGKVWDQELKDGAQSRLFLAGYRSVLPETADWPHSATLWVTRFVAALAAIPYALRVEDQLFLRHAIWLLGRLETELEA